MEITASAEDIEPFMSQSDAYRCNKSARKNEMHANGPKVWPENKDPKKKDAGLVVGCNHTSREHTNPKVSM